MNKIKLSDITFEPLVYTRKFQDGKRKLPYWQTTLRYRRLMDGGAKFPPIILTKIGSIIYLVDGYHRLLATKDRHKLVIDSEFIKCKNLKEVYIQALIRNNTNGQQLDSYELTVAIQRLKEEHHYGLDSIGKILSLQVVDVKRLIARGVRLTESGKEVVVKSPLINLKEIDEITEEDQKGFSGYSQLHTINELITLIEKDLLDTDNPQIAEAFEKLYWLIRQIMIPARPGRRRKMN